MQANLFIDSNLDAPDYLDAAGGRVGVFTRRSPEPEREHNEDAAAVFGLSDSSAVLVLADGVGGQRGGEVASSTAIEQLRLSIQRGLADGQSLRACIMDGFENANRAVLESGLGAATTLAVLEIDGDVIRSYHAGDSPIIAVGQRGKLKLETVAHSPVGYAVESGVLNEKDAMNHDERHIVSNVVGDSEMRIEVGPAIKMARHDTVILASDGLTDNLHTKEIIERIRKGPIEQVMSQVSGLARHRMESSGNGKPSKPDDLTFVVFRRSK